MIASLEEAIMAADPCAKNSHSVNVPGSQTRALFGVCEIKAGAEQYPPLSSRGFNDPSETVHQIIDEMFERQAVAGGLTNQDLAAHIPARMLK